MGRDRRDKAREKIKKICLKTAEEVAKRSAMVNAYTTGSGSVKRPTSRGRTNRGTRFVVLSRYTRAYIRAMNTWIAYQNVDPLPENYIARNDQLWGRAYRLQCAIQRYIGWDGVEEDK